MKVAIFIVLISVANCLFNRCVSYTGKCSDLSSVSAQFTSQYNINRKGIPTYQDTVSTQFGGKNCSSIMHQMLFHNKLKCSQDPNNKKVFNCEEYCEDVFYKVGDVVKYKQYQSLIDHCNPEITEKFISVKNTNCTGIPDPFGYLRNYIDKTSPVTITYDDNDNPILTNMSPDGKSCVWRYEVEGLWSTVVIFTLLAIVVVAIVLLAILIVYTQKRRAFNRNNLAKSLFTEGQTIQMA